MRPKDAKVWNEALVQALQAREQMARRMGKRTHLTWSDGWKKVQAVRADIYTFRNGRIVNFPTQLSKTVDNCCRSIIAGTEPILPRGYVPHDVSNEGGERGNPYLNDPYLNSIKKRGGAFAILMAFHQSDQVLTKDQICSLAQPFCDTEMMENYRAGRARGAWAAIQTLLSHDLVSVQQRAIAYNERAGGLRSQGKNSYMLTPNGRLFLQALLEKNPDLFPGATAGVARKPTRDAEIFHPNLGGDFRHLIPDLHRQDEGFEPWPDVFPTSAQTMVSLDHHHPVKSCPPRKWDTFAAAGGGVHTLESPVAKRRLDFPPPREAAALAAMERQAIQESIRMAAEDDKKKAAVPTKKASTTAQKVSKPLNGYATKKKASIPRSQEAVTPPTQMIDLTESRSKTQRKKAPPIIVDVEDDPPALVVPNEIWDLTDSQPMEVLDDDRSAIIEEMGVAVLLPQQETTPLTSLVIYIDDRERNRNDTPRALRLELTRLLTGTVFSSIWPSHMEAPRVEERRLPIADFAFGATTSETETLAFPIALERKRIGDIVNRSTKKDHWYQLQRMQDEASSKEGGICIMLLEGDPRTTEKFTPYGAQAVDTASPFVHTIDDEETLFRYIGRAILNDPTHTTRFIQTKDEQGTLRMVGVLGLLSISHERPVLSKAGVPKIDSKVERRLLQDRLHTIGVPYRIGQRIADELRSVQQMDQLYSSIDDVACRELALEPLLHDLLDSEDVSGTTSAWSTAVYRGWFSQLPLPNLANDRFQELSNLVENHALLLDKLHCGLSPDAAVDEVLGADTTVDDSMERYVVIDLPTEHVNCFQSTSEQDTGVPSFFRLQVADKPQKIPSIAMCTHAGPYHSARLLVLLLDGDDYVRRLSTSINDSSDLIGSARTCAQKMHRDFCVVTRPEDHVILLIQGMELALDNAAKKNGYRPELRVLADVMQAELMLQHQTIVLHAIRKRSGDREMIVRQLALACYHYHLLKYKDPSCVIQS